MLAYRLGYYVYGGFIVQHANFQGIGTDVAEYRFDLLRQKCGWCGVYGLHAYGVLHG